MSAQSVPETVVRNRSQYAGTIHRRDPEADEETPACPESDRPGAEFVSANPNELIPTFTLCRNPECFGREWR